MGGADCHMRGIRISRHASESSMRVWRDGVLTQPKCIAKATFMYFTDDEAKQPCGKKVILLPNFWLWHRSGNLDAHICDEHARMAMRGRGYLAERTNEATKGLDL